MALRKSWPPQWGVLASGYPEASPQLGRNGYAQALAVHGLGIKEAEPEGMHSWRLSVNITSCGRFSVKGRVEQGSYMAAIVPSKLPLLVEFPFQAVLPSTMPLPLTTLASLFFHIQPAAPQVQIQQLQETPEVVSCSPFPLLCTCSGI